MGSVGRLEVTVYYFPVPNLHSPRFEGQALRHQDLDLLALVPGTSWKAEDVEKVYQALEKKVGTPKSISADAAVELQEGAKFLKIGGNRTILFRDFKHYLANQFESLIGKTPRFTEFIKHVTNTRSAVQQTDLAHLSPPSLKPKSRFMNREPLLSWAMMVLWQLSNLTTKARQGIANEKLESKGGFTQLIIAFGALLKPSAPESIREDFERVKVQDVKNWLTKNLPATLSSKRQTAYHEYRQSQSKKSRKRATQTAVCA